MSFPVDLKSSIASKTRSEDSHSTDSGSADERLWKELGQRPQPQVPAQLQNNTMHRIRAYELEQQKRQFLLNWVFQRPVLSGFAALIACVGLTLGLWQALNLNSETQLASTHSSFGEQSSDSPSSESVSDADWQWLLGGVESNQGFELELGQGSAQASNLPAESTEAQLLSWEPYLEVDLLSAYASNNNWPSDAILAYEELF